MLAEKMRERRAKLQMSLKTDDEDNSASSQTPMIGEKSDESILDGMRSRRLQRLNDLSPEKNAAFVSESRSLKDNKENMDETLERTPASSMRERIRNRVKKQTQEAVPVSRKLRGLRERTLPNRFDSNDDVTNLSLLKEELHPSLQQSIATAREWKRLKTLKKKHKNEISEDDAMRFFIGEVDDDDETTNIQQQTMETEDNLELAIPMDDTLLINNVKPPVVPHKQQMKIEDAIYHYPSAMPPPTEQKVQEGCVVRDLRAEGFFIGKTPNVTLSALNKMQHRLLASDKSNSWFTEDGDLKRLSDPLKETLVRHVSRADDYHVPNPIQLQWTKAQPSSINTQYIDEQGFQHYQIDVDISLIKFTHHPLYSLEHVLESRLVQLYNQHVLRERSGVKEQIENKLQAIRTCLERLREQPADEERMKSHELWCEMGELYGRRSAERLKDRTLMHNMLATWQSLKRQRESQAYTSTTATLKIRKEKTNRGETEKTAHFELTEQLEGERALHLERHKSEYRFYQTNLIKWKKTMKQKKRLTEAGSADALQMLQRLESVVKPTKPPQFEEEQMLQMLEERMKQSNRNPGEAILTPILHNDAVITPNEKCSSGEQQRRAAIKNTRYTVKVLFNNLEVSRTSTSTLTNDFLVNFAEILTIKILQWPESIKVQIYEHNSHLIAELFTPLPECSAMDSSFTLETLDFSSDRIVHCKHDGVGSGMHIQLGEEQLVPFTTGVLYAGTKWGVDEQGVSLAPPALYDNQKSSSTQNDPLALLGASGLLDLQKLYTWLSSAKLDPNDPTNADVLNLAKMAQMSRLDAVTGPQYFRLSQLEQETEFVRQEEIDNNRRFRMIRLRNEGAREFKHRSMIPLDDRHIPQSAFNEYEKRLNEIEDEDEMDQRKIVAKFLEKVRGQIHERSLMAKSQIDLEDIVIEEEIPDIGSLSARIVQMMEPKRPLRPVRKERKKIGGQNVSNITEVHILINFVRAFNIPVRGQKSQQQQQPNPYNPNQVVLLSTETSVRPFIEVVFQNNTFRTSVGNGPAANWNEDIVLPFKAPNNDYTSDMLQTIKDKIYINLFDEIVVNLPTEGRDEDTNIHQRVEKRWLGCIDIPFTTLYFTSKIEGFLEVTTPAVLLGYHGENNAKDERTLLQLYATVEPQLQPAPPMPERFETSEDDMLVHNAQVWLAELRAKYPTREYKTMVTDIDGKKVFLCRYISPQKPPEELMLDQSIPMLQKMKLLARFVSLIPYVSDSVQFPDLCDIWATSDQFLQMLSGDEEEHAVLLCNFFLWLGLRAYLVLGTAVPEGSTAWVLCEEGGTQRLWNANTGESYELHNTYCPLIIVATLVNESNIYGNIQAAERPSEVNFSISNAKMWRPFFNKNYPDPGLGSIQSETPSYVPIDTHYAVNLSEKVERLLKEKIMEWRPRNITKFNRFCSHAFKTVLQSMESSRVMLGSKIEHTEPLAQVLASHQVTGFPLEMGYTDNSAVVERVYSTGIYECEDRDVEFSLAVHVHPYPSGVLALWLYVGRLTRKK